MDLVTCINTDVSRRNLHRLFSWLTVPRWYNRSKAVAAIPVEVLDQTSSGYSWWAQLAILVVTFLWSRVVDGVFFSGDAIAYFNMLQDGSWTSAYRYQPTMFVLLSALKPDSFTEYVFYSGLIPLTVLLYAFYRLNYSRLDQFLLIGFFSSSFYGLHFLLDFQRQFYAVVLFVLAVSLGKRSHLPVVVTRVGSLLSHTYSFALHLFAAAGRLRWGAALLLCVPIIPALLLLANVFVTEQTAVYLALGEGAGTGLLVKEALNITYVLIILLTLQKGENGVRTMCSLYIGLSIPALLSASYAGVFVRFDYYFFPALIALWPTRIRTDRRGLFRAVLVASTIFGFYLWMRLNFAWIVNGVG